MTIKIIIFYLITGYLMGLIACYNSKDKQMDNVIKTMLVWTFAWLFLFVFGQIPYIIFGKDE